MAYKITSEFLEHVKGLIFSDNEKEIKKLFKEIHYADVAEILDELNFEEAIYIIKLLRSRELK